MIEFVALELLGVMFGGRFGMRPDEAATVAGGAWVPLYLVSSAVFPYRRCPWPWCSTRNPTHSDKRGNYRLRRGCRFCHGQPWRRVGARLIGAGS